MDGFVEFFVDEVRLCCNNTYPHPLRGTRLVTSIALSQGLLSDSL